VGFFGAVTGGLLEADALRQAVADSVPAAMRKLNLDAFEKGYEYGARLIESLGRSRRTEPVHARLEHEV
jgi:2-oxoglutarate ferredoxin oxidoreductase subunit gamma